MRRLSLLCLLALLAPSGARAEPQACSLVVFMVSPTFDSSTGCRMNLDPGSREVRLSWSADTTGYAFQLIYEQFDLPRITCEIVAGVARSCAGVGIDDLSVKTFGSGGGSATGTLTTGPEVFSLIEVRTWQPTPCFQGWCPGLGQGTFQNWSDET